MIERSGQRFAWVLLALIGPMFGEVDAQDSRGAGDRPPGAVLPVPKLGELASESKPTLDMSPAVVCSRVDGLERYSPVPDATLTNADKLKVYFRPLHYKVETDLKNKSPYRAKFVEDGRIRRKGEKTVLAKEDKLLEYDTRFDTTDYRIYLVNTVGLEDFPPGEYEFDIILHDMIDGQATAKQSLPFRIVASEVKPAAEPPAGLMKSKKAPMKPGRSSKRPDR